MLIIVSYNLPCKHFHFPFNLEILLKNIFIERFQNSWKRFVLTTTSITTKMNLLWIKIGDKKMSVLSYERLDDIIEYLLIKSTKKTPLTELVRELAVSDRTIRNDINLINESIALQHATIRLYRGEGYCLVFTNKSDFLIWWNAQKKQRSQYFLDNPELRQEYLLYLLLTQESPLSLDSLLEKLFVSKNTFYSYLKNIKSLLLPFDLKIYNQANIGFELQGTEFNKRSAIMDLLIKKNLEDYIIDFSEMEYTLFSSIDLDQLKKIEIHHLQRFDLFDSDYYHKNILSILGLTIVRIQQSHFLDIMPVKVPEAKKKVQTTMDHLLFNLEEQFQIVFSTIEREFIYFHLLSNFPRLVENSDQKNQYSETAQAIVEDLLQEIYETTAYNWINDNVLKKDLTAHIESFISLTNFSTDRSNPLLKTIKASFPLAYDLSLIHLETIGKKYGLYFSEDEIGYIALHLAGAIERNDNHITKKIRVAIVCGSGLTMSKLIALKLNKKYSHLIEIIGNYSYIEFIGKAVPNVDLIISTIPLPTEQINVEVIKMNDLDSEIIRLEKIFDQQIDSQAYIYDLFQESQFFVFDQKMTKQEVLTHMSKQLEMEHYVDALFLPSVLERESIESTQIGDSIAIPHPMALLSKKTVVSIGIAPNGISWNEQNDKINFIFLFSIRKKDYENTEGIYDLLLQFLEDIECQKRLLINPTFSSFIQAMQTLSY